MLKSISILLVSCFCFCSIGFAADPLTTPQKLLKSAFSDNELKSLQKHGISSPEKFALRAGERIGLDLASSILDKKPALQRLAQGCFEFGTARATSEKPPHYIVKAISKSRDLSVSLVPNHQHRQMPDIEYRIVASWDEDENDQKAIADTNIPSDSWRDTMQKQNDLNEKPYESMKLRIIKEGGRFGLRLEERLGLIKTDLFSDRLNWQIKLPIMHNRFGLSGTQKNWRIENEFLNKNTSSVLSVIFNRSGYQGVQLSFAHIF